MVRSRVNVIMVVRASINPAGQLLTSGYAVLSAKPVAPPNPFCSAET